MASFRHALKVCMNPYLTTRRLLNYSAIVYDGKENPAKLFFNPDIQTLLKSLTRVDYERVFKAKKLGTKKLSDPQYKFMTDSELQDALKEVQEKAEELLQIPPVVQCRDTKTRVLAQDPALQGLESSRLVFTDITYGIRDSDRIIVIREPDGTLQEAEWAVRQRMNQLYFPKEQKALTAPKMFDGQYLESLLERGEYEYILDRACLQFEPDDTDYQRIVSIVYQHLNDKNKFDTLRSTRHFGSLVFFLAWNKNIDNLLLDLIETLHIEEARDLVSLHSRMHEIKLQGETPLDLVRDYVEKHSTKKAALELSVQAYKDVTLQAVKESSG